MKKVCWPYFDPEFDTLQERINGPTCRVTIDNENTGDCTVVKVHGVNKEGLLLEVVQVLTDMNLQIWKGYISSDADWFMDVFHVRDEHGNKLTDEKVINNIQQAVERSKGSPHTIIKSYSNNNIVHNYDLPPTNHTAIEMTGAYHPGLFSEISAALTDLRCNIIKAHAWTHNSRLACVAYISDQSSLSPIQDPNRLALIEGRLALIEGRLTTILRSATTTGGAAQREVKTAELHGGEGTMMTSVERRLHQLMVSVRDFEGSEMLRRKRMVKIESCKQKGYSIVTIECKDRPRLMFDIVCTLTDMQYVIFHASIITSHNGCASQEYFIRHRDGYALSTESEKERVVLCLEAAIERRVCEGVRVELCAEDRVGMLSDITRMLRENGLAVVRADVETRGQKCVHTFYVRGVSGNYDVDIDYFLQSVQREMGPTLFHLNNNIIHSNSAHNHDDTCITASSLGHKLRSHIERLSQALFISSNSSSSLATT